MELVDIRIRNFRSVGSEQRLPLDGGLTLVGPNNSGKTNLLRAVRMLFTGLENRFGYTRSADLTFGAGRNKTSIIGTFRGDPNGDDAAFFERLDELHTLQGTDREGKTEVPLTLYFSPSDTPVYNFFPNIKRPPGNAAQAQYSRTQRQLVTDLVESFAIHYVPSAKSVEALYTDLLLPFLRRTAADALAPHLDKVREDLEKIAGELTIALGQAGLDGLTAAFTFPDRSAEKLIAGFDFMLSDPSETSIFEKGMGIQATALLASFIWITHQEREHGSSVIWLLEEPESYLHPELSEGCLGLLRRLSDQSLLLVTTHSLGFVPQDPEDVRGTVLIDGRTDVQAYRTFAEATATIRESLGIKFSDFYNLDLLNVLTEGPSDRELIGWFLELSVGHTGCEWPHLRRASVVDFGGVKHLSGFLRATYEFIARERVAVAVFDGDDAGVRERSALQGYFGNRQIPFAANREFVSTRDRFAIEGLFPDEWMVDLNSEHAGWFETFSVDPHGAVEPFKIKDRSKSQAAADLRRRAESEDDLEWASRWRAFAGAVDSALRDKADDLYGAGSA